ncbi:MULTISPECIES: error-prone DNA polymerase [unclassified Janthinobacterium]|uniref:error-prone DNA polymerase n=1 Tax=unclassified Janthinobacterium TaxID=2610881 RepID=UPI000883F9F0|nr:MULTISPECIES: error-prone DNA polymerase [unclassified Janthinobacterium]SDA43843.1 error-prone DNA polymerase [Janthinobacterium sp. 551a]SFA92560.1 error-prone DNA polymerase [Janthinobacterium sp. 344]
MWGAVLPEYAELYCLTNFSFLQGASHAQELVARAVQLGYRALAITDECSLAGVVRAHAAAKRAGFPLIIGAHFHLTQADGSPGLSLLALVQDFEGYGNLSELITMARTRAAKGRYLLTPDDFAAPSPGFAHLRGLPGCLMILLPSYPAQPGTLHAQGAWMAATFGRERSWVGLNLLQRAQDDAHRGAVQAAAQAQGLSVVAVGQVCMHVRSRKPLLDTLCAIRVGKAVGECGYALAQNAEQHLRARLRLANVYPPQALAETMRIAGMCQFSLDSLRYDYPDELVPHGHTTATYLREETYAGARIRFPLGIPANVQEQIEQELELIAELSYEAYFLTVYDIVRFARSHNILCQGRGSAANSAVCYCLGITEVDPARGNSLVGRFMSRERNEPPDIDVDFEHQRREEVIQYIYGKYGRERAALAAVVISYRPKSALRDSGRALGIDLAIVEKVSKAHRWFDGKHDLLNRLAECGLDPEAALSQQWASLAQQLLGFPRHLSQHPGGFVIAQGKLSRLVPIENASMAERSVIEWDKDDLEELGLMKVDVLALGMLSALRRALELVGARRGEEFRLQDIPAEDSATYDMMCEADTIGVFQIESRAQMSMLPRLRPRVFYDLVIEVALVRPGPIQGGMVHPYLQRRQKKEPVVYPNGLEKALGRTLGIPIFQEQVMQVAIIAADFTPGEADQLRRAMAAWKRKGGMNNYKERIVETMVKNGYDREFAEAIFSQIEGFGEYGFPESHAASFALLTYASSWLKCHEPAAFLCALLNSQPMGFYSPSQLVQDGRRHGVRVLPVDVAVSGWEAALEASTQQAEAPAVRLGLNSLYGMRAEAARRIEDARAIAAFLDVADLARRGGLDRHDLQVLAAGNALQALAGNRRAALWQAAGAVPDKDLLRASPPEEDAPVLAAPTEGESIVSDYRAQGLTLGRHPLALLRKQLLAQRFLSAATLNCYTNGQVARACGIVTVRQRPGTAKGVVFMTLEDETGTVNVIVWPDLVESQRREVLSAPLLGVYGVWQQEGIVRNLVARRLVDMSHLLGRLRTSSRDFC